VLELLHRIVAVGAADLTHQVDGDIGVGVRGQAASLGSRGLDTPDGELVHNFHDPADLPDQVVASRRAAVAARRVIAGLAATRLDATTLDEVSGALEGLAELLEPSRPTSRYAETGGLHGGVLADAHVWESHPFIGPSHPLAPPFVVRRVGARAIGTVTFGHVYEGPPGAVHGGVVAAMFDMVLGAATSIAKLSGLTGTLSVRYRKATPLYREIRYEAWVERVEERKVLVSGVSTCDDELVAEGDAVFVRVDTRRYDPPAEPADETEEPAG
jgi:acyl-coenzyme A thioesterase PaaI-like protein